MIIDLDGTVKPVHSAKETDIEAFPSRFMDSSVLTNNLEK